MPTKSTIKRAVVKKATKKPSKTQEQAIQVLSVGSCSSVSGVSTLKYQIGIDADSAIQLKILSSSGSGFVNPTWYPLERILDVLTAHSVKKPIKSSDLTKGLELCGKSRNDSAFIVATLAANDILVPLGGQEKYQWKYNSADALLAKVEQLKSGNALKTPRKKSTQ